MEGSTEETLHENEQEEVYKTLGLSYTKEDDDDPMRSVAVLNSSTILTDWTSCCSQSPLLELPNKQRNFQRKR